MPPVCEVGPDPPRLPPPRTREPFPPLSMMEEELFDIAIRLDCALREFGARGGIVNTKHYINSIVEELVSKYMTGLNGY